MCTVNGNHMARILTSHRVDYGVVLTASMTTGDSCQMVVKVDTAEFDAEGDPALAYGCDFRPVSSEFIPFFMNRQVTPGVKLS